MFACMAEDSTLCIYVYLNRFNVSANVLHYTLLMMMVAVAVVGPLHSNLAVKILILFGLSA